jgi:uncharacterized membrane protein YqjE
MATDLQTHNEPSLTNLVKGVIDDVQSLTKQQFALLKQELKEDMTKTRKAAMPMVVGLIVAFIGVLLLGHGLALLLHWIFPGLPEWAGYAIVGVLITGAGGALFFAGEKQFEKFSPLPDRSLEALKENVECLTNPKECLTNPH